MINSGNRRYLDNEALMFSRILHRKDIYKDFP